MAKRRLDRNEDGEVICLQCGGDTTDGPWSCGLCLGTGVQPNTKARKKRN